MASTKISDLVPELQKLYKKFEKAMKAAGLDFKVTCTARTFDEQIALYAQGRKPLKETNELREKAGLPPITANENKKIVTWTLKSKHVVSKDSEKARAFDIVLLVDNRPHWNIKVDVNKNLKADYIEAAEIAKAVGLIPGAFFKNPDYVHFEI